jgi:MFS family permease
MTAEVSEGALPSKQELLSFQESWLRPAGAAALGGAIIAAAGIVVGRIGLDLPSADSDADQLAFVHAHSGRLILSAVLQGIGFSLFAVPLVVLFKAASGRAERMRGAFVGLAALGPVALSLALVISSIGSSHTSDKFADQVAGAEQQARQHAQASAAADAKQTATSSKTKGSTTAPATTTPSTQGTVTTTTPAGTTTAGAVAAGAKPPTPEQAASDARESLADDLNKDSGLLTAGAVLQTIAALSLVFGLIYTNLWAMRTGLLSRFWGALGMAFGLFLIFPLFPAIPGIVLWFAVLGLMFLGLWPRPLPPAWAAGEAVPWVRPGDDIGPPPERPGPGGTVEGSGREVSEEPLPENGAPSAPGAAPEQPSGEGQGPRRKKRKRRN